MSLPGRRKLFATSLILMNYCGFHHVPAGYSCRKSLSNLTSALLTSGPA
jgi:hypothetical protein